MPHSFFEFPLDAACVERWQCLAGGLRLASQTLGQAPDKDACLYVLASKGYEVIRGEHDVTLWAEALKSIICYNLLYIHLSVFNI